VEVLVYIVVLFMVLGAGSALLYRAWSNNIAVRRNADDVVRALSAGELWRADVRTANGPIVTRDGRELHIPTSRGEILYQFANETISRQAPGQQPRNLTRVLSSQMEQDRREKASGWKWEIELQHNRKDLQFRPLFTFEAVTSNEVKK
ncbi:MAG: hypothetical protein JWO95_399, partial [Verrucomicrobiales bacterium]|nr:hypothetical protein [Verrucomicrobiales bacterium]